jgi:hypothetical protein
VADFVDVIHRYVSQDFEVEGHHFISH